MPKVSSLKNKSEVISERSQGAVIKDAETKKPAKDLSEVEIIDTNDFSEEEFQNSIEKTKRDTLVILKKYVEDLANKNNKLNIKDFRQIQQLFDSLWKQEVARENILLKKRQENRADTMAVFDIYGRFGSPDPETLESMRQALYGKNFPQLK